MTEQEYLNIIKALDQWSEVIKKRKKEVRQQYIESQPIHPGQVVIVDGVKVWLERYDIVCDRISPCFHYLKPDGTRSHKLYYCKDKYSMHEIEG